MKIVKKHSNFTSFGHVLSNKRSELKIGLRKLAEKVGFDPGNLSKIERNLLPPPKEMNILSKLAIELGMGKGSNEYHTFIDRAYLTQGSIPPDLSKSILFYNLLSYFRTIRNYKPLRLKDITEDWDV